MHDILEGSLQYEVKELLKHLIQAEHFFTLKELNESIEGFPYVASDKATKPSIIAPQVLSSSDESLKQKGNTHTHNQYIHAEGQTLTPPPPNLFHYFCPHW